MMLIAITIMIVLMMITTIRAHRKHGGIADHDDLSPERSSDQVTPSWRLKLAQE
ncbi:Fsn-glycerol-3-phosphate dehydrogenase-like protein [Anopheles sinensis]|uniref:Fsn-glycerol-3-phosphate dehydrogenase-like protein n=1 Tax=Anopheles sinensis TaxID=74873 RepID=A0A084W7V8_ANOSI|nr:Fsn-glycerol-3-phosphate dehydrogenase-like protein [Anopheles sinensis]